MQDLDAPKPDLPRRSYRGIALAPLLLIVLAPGAPVVGAPRESGADLTGVRQLIRSGDRDRALERLAEIRLEHPDAPEVLLLHGELLLAQRRPAEARAALDACARLDPERPRVHFQLAAALSALGDSEGALEHYRLEIRHTSEPRLQVMAHLNRSMLYRQNRAWPEAAAELEAVLGLDPDKVQLYGDLAGLYLQSRNLERAADSLERGRRAGFESARLLYDLGSRYRSASHPHEALRAFRQALEIDPDLADVHRGLGDVLEQLGDRDGAVQHFRHFLELRPESPLGKEIQERIRDLGGA